MNNSYSAAEDENGKSLGKFSLEQSHKGIDEMTAVVRHVQRCCVKVVSLSSVLFVQEVRARKKGHQVQP